MTGQSAAREPEDGFESVMQAGRAGTATMGEVFTALGEAALIVPSRADFGGAPQNFQPLLFTSAEGAPMMAVFTAADRLALFASTAPWSTTMSGRSVLTNLQEGVGLVINPASDLGMEVAAADVKRVLASLPAAAPEPGPNLVVERAIRDARVGAVPHATVMAQLSRASLYVASSTPIAALINDITPLVLDYQEQPHIAVFTRHEYMTPFTEQARYLAHMPLASFVGVLRADAGIVVNPGLDWAYLLQPSDVAQLRG